MFEGLNSFTDWGPYHIETSPLICTTNQWTGFYMIETSVMKELDNASAECITNKIKPEVYTIFLD